jgi:RNA polymerase sigma-70 factor (ECF subfamily)
VVTDEALYAQVLEGDRAALAELVARYHAPLLHFLYRMTADQQAAEDMVQDTFMRLLTYEGEAPRRFKSWLFAVARNRAYDTFRSAAYTRETTLAPEAEAELPTARPGAETLAERQANREAVAGILQALQPHHREALVLRFYHDLSLKEIAEITDCPLGTVKSRLYHALRQAKTHVERREVIHER